MTPSLRLCSLALSALVVGGACSRSASEPKPDANAKTEAEPASEAPACGQVAYVTTSATDHDHGGHQQLALVPAAGGASQSLGLDEDRSHFPAAVAPDGSALLILSSETLPSGKTRDQFSLLALGPDGPSGSPRPIGPADGALRNPSFSPDGAFIVFESDAGSFRDLYRLDLASDSLLRLTDNPEGNFEPAVSPDARSVVFVSSRDGDAELYLMSADGGDHQRLTHSPGDDAAPRWHPSGARIAFVSARDRARGMDGFEIGRDGSGVRPLVGRDGDGDGDGDGSRGAVIVRDLSFDPSGSRLAFTELAPRAGRAAVVVVDASTGEVLVRTDGEGVDEQPSWSPDGLALVFARSVAGRSSLVRMARDGSALAQLTPAGPDAPVTWLPRWIGTAQCVRTRPQVEVVPSRG